ncbi:hypothetical protein J416_02801 [Gracilibacillus halophilus YIM-C55.5]|uniref:SPOR domain-containing protein n=1 Tax=Gracilibacillus halophilus YIM-C55.5 TaxID=1308866 RepID=N4WCE6_9BACI|nr:SPOR domain-containing protein [Gracilibacillus halophilus]ENH97948.1 hypothetical protein J416_02801 [Gracilibacillus halophilus YIM-C55.5]
MKHKRDISVHINHQKKEPSYTNQDKEHDSVHSYLEKINEAQYQKRTDMSDSQEDHVYRRDYLTETSQETNIFPRKKMNRWKDYKSYILSAVAAVIIGSLFGLFMLKIFVDMDPEEVAFQDDQRVNATGDPEEESNRASSNQSSDSKTTAFEFDSSQAYVVQAGVFSSNESANKYVTKLEDKGSQAMVWEKEGTFHVFIGVHDSVDASKQFARQAFQLDQDIYPAKEWRTEAFTINMTAAEKEWFDPLPELINQTIAGTVSVDEWNNWLQQQPDQSETISPLIEKVEAIIPLAREDKSSQELQVALLELWYTMVGLKA